MKYWTLAVLLIALNGSAQIAGANVFGSDQVLRVDLTFNQTGFWDSLVANYAIEKDMIAAGLTITDNQGVHVMDSIAIRLKGNSSYGHPGNKKSFKIDINDYVSGQNYDGLKKLNFNNCFKDPSFMREKIIFDMCQELQIPAPRVTYANVYMNGTFWGFYNLVEQIDDQFLDWAILDDQGNLFKAGDNFGGGNLSADLVYYDANQTSYEGRYELKTNETANDWTDLINLIDYINNSSSFASDFNTNFNKTKLLQSIAVDNLFSSLDSYLNSARNYYIYHNMTTNQWEWIKWDGNEAFGLYTGGPGLGNLEQLAPNYAAGSRPLLTKIFNDPGLYQDYLTEMCNILGTHFNTNYLFTRINEVKALIESHVTADVNKMYTTQNFIDNIEQDITVSGGPMGSQTVFGLKSFISDRNAYLRPLISCTANVSEQTIDGNIYPNPFTNYFSIDAAIAIIGIKDALGRSISFEQTKNGNVYEIEVFGNTGIYFLEIEQNKSMKTVTLVKN